MEKPFHLVRQSAIGILNVGRITGLRETKSVMQDVGVIGESITSENRILKRRKSISKEVREERINKNAQNMNRKNHLDYKRQQELNIAQTILYQFFEALLSDPSSSMDYFKMYMHYYNFNSKYLGDFGCNGCLGFFIHSYCESLGMPVEALHSKMKSIYSILDEFFKAPSGEKPLSGEIDYLFRVIIQKNKHGDISMN